MKWSNSALSWQQFERTLSGREAATGSEEQPVHPRAARSPYNSTDRGDDRAAPDSTLAYAELHAHSNFSFLDGASSPEKLVAEAARLGLTGLALTDHDGLQGAAFFAEAAADTPELATVYGAELTLGLDAPQLGAADPAGTHLLVLAHGIPGYHRLSAAITEGQFAGEEKGRPVYQLEALAEASSDEWVVLTGCRKGAVRRALENASNRSEAETDARAALDQLTALFGHDRVFVELTDHGHPGDDVRNDRLAALASEAHLPTLATGAVHYATAAEAPLAETMAAIRARRSLEEMNPYLPASGSARLRSGSEMHRRFARHRAAVSRTAPLAAELGFPLRAARPRLPRFDVPAGHTQMSWLRELVFRGAAGRYQLPDTDIEQRLEKELALIAEKDFPGYFLIVHDIVRFASEQGILCQGRGSAANSAVCYVLGITAVDSVFYELPFERFLNSMRDEEPDIDVDFESDRREEVIQYVYERYGRRNAAQVANVISYRPKSAVRDAAKALGYTAAQQRKFTAGLERRALIPEPAAHTRESAQRPERNLEQPRSAPGPRDTAPPAEPAALDLPHDVAHLAAGLIKAPRHLGIHSGGMVLTEHPVGEICPIEHARMPGRTVLQWDKDGCAAMGLVKFDLLGLGMLSALHTTFDLAAEATGEQWTLDTLPREEPGVYDMLCRADAIGVFQLESRAQLNTLPRLRPRRYYDLVIEIALIRPGPLQGGAIHPYLRRRNNTEAVTFPHSSLEPVLERTLGVPLFQEQLMQMAMAVGGCGPEEADQLRRAMGSKRGIEKIERLRTRLFEGMAAHGIDEKEAELIYAQIESFANFGFAESHSLSFALLVYASAWLKLHYPAAFLAGLLRSQPMGFYAPRTLVEDARRHGVRVLPPDVQHSAPQAALESLDPRARPSAGSPLPRPGSPTGRPECLNQEQPPTGSFDPTAPDTSAAHRRDGGFAVRFGLADVRGIEQRTAERIARARQNGPFQDLADLARRADLDRSQLEALASAGACASFGANRRETLWNAAPAADNRDRYLPGIAVHVQPPLLPVLSSAEQTALDLWSTGVVAGQHPLAIMRDELDQRGVIRSDALARATPQRTVHVAGLVTHRQRPQTAGGITFVTLEDETGSVNIVVWQKVWQKYRLVARAAPALFVTGVLERTPEGVVNVIAHAFEPLTAPGSVTSRDFR